MNIYEDGESLTIEQAIDLLYDGKIIRINDSADRNEDRELLIDITDIVTYDIIENQLEEETRDLIKEYLSKYEIYW